MNHYHWLDKHLPAFFEKLGVSFDLNAGIIVAHGDKCYCYRNSWEKAGIHFCHGVAIYLLTYVSPFSWEVRDTTGGWVDPAKWVIENKDRFLPLLDPIPFAVSKSCHDQWCIQIRNPKPEIRKFLRAAVSCNFIEDERYKLSRQAGAFLQCDYPDHVLIEFWKGPVHFEPFVEWLNENYPRELPQGGLICAK